MLRDSRDSCASVENTCDIQTIHCRVFQRKQESCICTCTRMRQRSSINSINFGWLAGMHKIFTAETDAIQLW